MVKLCVVGSCNWEEDGPVGVG